MVNIHSCAFNRHILLVLKRSHKANVTFFESLVAFLKILKIFKQEAKKADKKARLLDFLKGVFWYMDV